MGVIIGNILGSMYKYGLIKKVTNVEVGDIITGNVFYSMMQYLQLLL